MSASMSVERTARRTANSTFLEALARVGFIGYGLFHLAIMWLAVQIAVQHSAGEADQVGAFQLLRRQPAGRTLLVIIAIGLGAMALWQLLLAAVGHTSYPHRRRILERLASAGRVIVYGFLLWTDIQVLRGTAQPATQSQQSAASGMLAHSAGRTLVALAGLVVLGFGVGMAIYGAKLAFRDKLNLAGVRHTTRTAILNLGRVGYLARGLAFTIVGVLLIDVAFTHRVDRSRGLDGALRTLAGQPFGRVLLVLIAAGFGAFGIYCFAQSKYRRI
jgi:Domain of Unknown Function (DUF1206)